MRCQRWNWKKYSQVFISHQTNSKLRIHNKRLKRDCQRAAFPVPLSRGGALLRNSFSKPSSPT
ncbi:hypothetical protein FXE35_08335 [Vibrio cholerae]|nr:hypothetical protein FXE35_08335 [Vibrio cholerae]